jgi:hypothetical protein
MLSGCYYDPNTGYTYPYPPPYGYPQQPSESGPPPQGGASLGALLPESGAPPGGPPGQEYGAPPGQGYGALPGQGYGAPPGQGYGAPPGQGYGAPPGQGYGAPPAQADVITRDQFVQRAVQRANRLNRNAQLAAQRAGTMFDQIDVNHVGAVTREQIRAWREAHMRAPQGGQPPASE